MLEHTKKFFVPHLAILFLSVPVWAGIDDARNFLDAEIGTTSVLNRAQQEAEMQWFVDAAEAFEGMSIKFGC